MRIGSKRFFRYMKIAQRIGCPVEQPGADAARAAAVLAHVGEEEGCGLAEDPLQDPD